MKDEDELNRGKERDGEENARWARENEVKREDRRVGKGGFDERWGVEGLGNKRSHDGSARGCD